MSGTVTCSIVHDDGHGPALYLGGTFSGPTGLAIPHLARWRNDTWDDVGGTTDGAVESFTVFDDGSGAALYAGGNFVIAGTSSACGIARWRACDLTGEALCSGDGSATACPCGNAGSAGHGCATSTNASGAELHAAGFASVSSDSLVLECNGTSNSTVTYFQGTQRVNAGAGAVFGDGLRCAGGVTLRLAHVLATAGASRYPNAGDTSLSIRGAVAALGGRREYQVWFRNAASFCTPSMFNLSNGWSVAWAP